MDDNRQLYVKYRKCGVQFDKLSQQYQEYKEIQEDVHDEVKITVDSLKEFDDKFCQSLANGSSVPIHYYFSSIIRQLFYHLADFC